MFFFDSGMTPLHLHAAHGRAYGTSCLLHQGADVNKQTIDTGISAINLLFGWILTIVLNNSGSTALHFAARYKQAEVAKLLLAYGAKTSTSNKLGERPKDLGLSDLTM